MHQVCMINAFNTVMIDIREMNTETCEYEGNTKREMS